MTTLDMTFVRARFPAFAVPGLADKAFFENAGGSYACAPVIDRLTRFYRERKVQPYAPYAAATAGGAEMDEARARLAAYMGIGTHELSFGPSTTANTYVLAQAFRRALLPGEAVVVTDQDHEANSGPWRRLGEEGVEILANGRSTRRPGISTLNASSRSWPMAGCGLRASRIARTWWRRSIRWPRSSLLPMKPAP